MFRKKINVFDRTKDNSEPNATIYILDSYSKDEAGNTVFNFPVGIVIPDNVSSELDLMVTALHPYPVKDYSFDEAITSVKEEFYKLNIADYMKHYMIDTGNVLMIPLIPTIPGYSYASYGAQIRKNDFSESLNYIKEDMLHLNECDLSKFINLDDQIKLMIEYTKCLLNCLNINYSDKLIMLGYDKTCGFSTGFTVLHSNDVLMVVNGNMTNVGYTGYRKVAELSLNYPLGHNDIKNYDAKEFFKVRHYYFSDKDRPKILSYNGLGLDSDGMDYYSKLPTNMDDIYDLIDMLTSDNVEYYSFIDFDNTEPKVISEDINDYYLQTLETKIL